MIPLPNLHKVIEITRRAGKILHERFETDIEVGVKGTEEIVTEADRESERFLLEELRSLLPEAGFFGEETGFHPGDSGLTWVVDPLDGTHNYSLRIPLWACMVGLLDENRVPVLGVIDFPVLKHTIWAERGGGAFRDGEPTSVSTDPLIGTSVIGIQSKVRLDPFPGHVQRIAFRYSARSLGAIAYHTYLLVTGRMRGCADLKVKLHDIAAPTVIIREAGGIVSDIDGSPIFPLSREFEDLVDYPLPFFAGDPRTGPELLKYLFPDGTPEGIYDPVAYQTG